ncbi:hypothetical protein PybrP1_009603, partial [[Pythium] brassicae (nom. inval.)]
MSSLAAARADNFYYPREWRPEHGTLNQLHGGGGAARKKSDGSQVVRFEMPFDARCTHCDASIGRGVRFNARKSRCGAYLSTPLYAFVLSCPHCKGAMRVETDPEHRGYRLASGVRKKVDAADVVATAAPDNREESHDVLESTERLNDPQVAQQLRADPFFRLEHEQDDRRVARQRADGIEALRQLRDARDSDSYASNAGLRAHFRSEKKQRERREAAGAKLGLSVPLLDACEEDAVAARAVVYSNIPGKKRRRRGGDAETEQRKAKAGGTLAVSSSDGGSHNSSLVKSSLRESRGQRMDDSFQHFGDAQGSQLHRLK